MSARYHSTNEAKRQAVQSSIDACKSSAERNRLGQFATPGDLSVDIARFVGTLIGDRKGGIRFADPSIGTGSFFSAALAVYGAERIQSAVGIEIDPAFARAAGELWNPAGLEVIHGDFTRLVASGARVPAPNLILANPPYVRHHHIGASEKERLQSLTFEMTGTRINGLAGLYVYFLLLATAWLEDSGHAAWLIPSEFMDVNYGSSLRRFLTERVTLVRLHRFDPQEVQFSDAFVSSVVVVFRKAPPPAGHEPEFTYGGSLMVPHAQERVSLEQLRESCKWTTYPRHANNDRRAAKAGNGATLADFFRIKRGIATGDNKYFILDRKDAERRRLPADYLRPILPSPRHLKTSVIEADDDGYPRLEPQLCVIDCDLSEQLVQRRFPGLWKYLEDGEDSGVKGGYLASKRSPWYKQEQRDPCPLLCTYMGRGAGEKQPFRFILNRSKAIGTNLYLMLYPRGEFACMLKKHPERLSDVHRILCQITGDELRGQGRVYGGGLNKIEPRELGRISAEAIIEQWPMLRKSVQQSMPVGLFE